MQRLYDWLFGFPGWNIHPIFLFYVLPAILAVGVVAGLYFWMV